MRDLIEALAARTGIVCAVGAGGKKTTLYRLAAAHPGRVGLSATVLTAPFPSEVTDASIVADEEELEAAVTEAARRHRVVGFACPSSKRARHAGVSASRLAHIHRAAGFDVTLVKADGARTRWIKAPRAGEPVIPKGASTVLPIVSALAIGATLSDEVAHRPGRIAEVTGARPGARLTVEHLARLLSHPEGALRGVADATVVPVLNMVEDAQRQRQAREVARRALQLSRRFDRVVLATMRATEPIVAVVER